MNQKDWKGKSGLDPGRDVGVLARIIIGLLVEIVCIILTDRQRELTRRASLPLTLLHGKIDS